MSHHQRRRIHIRNINALLRAVARNDSDFEELWFLFPSLSHEQQVAYRIICVCNHFIIQRISFLQKSWRIFPFGLSVENLEKTFLLGNHSIVSVTRQNECFWTMLWLTVIFTTDTGSVSRFKSWKARTTKSDTGTRRRQKNLRYFDQETWLFRLIFKKL